MSKPVHTTPARASACRSAKALVMSIAGVSPACRQSIFGVLDLQLCHMPTSAAIRHRSGNYVEQSLDTTFSTTKLAGQKTAPAQQASLRERHGSLDELVLHSWHRFLEQLHPPTAHAWRLAIKMAKQQGNSSHTVPAQSPYSSHYSSHYIFAANVANHEL